MPTPDEMIARYKAAFAAAKTPRVTPARGGFLFQFEPEGPGQLFTPEQFGEMICHLEGRAPLLDNGVALSSEDSGNGPVPPDGEP
jgi:hypothetical protein